MNTPTRWILITATTLTAAMSAGCTDVGSSDVTTHGLHADISVEDDAGAGTSRVTAVLRVGGGMSDTYVELEGDDALSVTLDGETLPLEKSSFFDAHTYSATFDRAPADLDYVVAFDRTVDDGAPDSRVQLPPAFDLAVTRASFSRDADDLEITWTDPSDDPMSLTIEGGCIETHRDEVDGLAGSHVVPARTLEDDDDDDDAAAADCELTVALERSRAGTVDPGYGEGGAATGARTRSTSVLSTP